MSAWGKRAFDNDTANDWGSGLLGVDDLSLVDSEFSDIERANPQNIRERGNSTYAEQDCRNAIVPACLDCFGFGRAIAMADSLTSGTCRSSHRARAITSLPYSLVLMNTLLALIVGCHRVETTKPSGNGQQSTQPRETMNDPEMMELEADVRRNPGNAVAYWKRASAWHARDRFDLAFRDFDEAIRLDPTNSVYYDARGFAHHMNNRQEVKALADYDEAIRLDPVNHHALNNRAYLLATTLDDMCRDGRRALEDVTKACDLPRWGNPGYLGHTCRRLC